MINFILMIDAWFEHLMLSVRTPFFVEFFSGVTFFGDILTVIIIAALVSIFLLSAPRRMYIAGLVTTLFGAVASVYVLKTFIAQARPGGLLPAISETSFSFPSWHAAASVALYGFIAFLLCRLYPERKRAVTIVATILILLIGFSRLYLGVHFPSDVIAGYLLGGLWLYIGIRVTKKFDKTVVIG